MKPIKLYWCRGEGRSDPSKQNFGDYLSPLLVELLSGRKVEYAPVQRADLMAVGSILGREAKAKRWGFLPYRLHIWGTGTGAEQAHYSGRHHYHAVRGALTRAQIDGLRSDPVLGDPGLLAPWVLGDRERPVARQIRVGLIPHYADQAEPAVAELLAGIPGARLINVFSPVKQVLAEIASCDFVLSSSMHGLIVADSFGVPNQWLLLSRGRISEYKFADYYSAFGLSGLQPLLPQTVLAGGPALFEQLRAEYRRPGLERIQQDLLGSFPQL
ncbi:polysaccharide pyruvyl transferase family protein [Pseudomonas oryzae]|uniref:Polysaccharide pyruvyl transferase n=1 Tax=Pseudomonas oryzae TaxID=1392877 RepID=A0A1H1VUY2_9PSED|nr:polysaccharide pyruvyl transferase family protein [Pseudomonas oryzae]SDS88563.1 Polysaccharide pyruvyl transferase [Pseudomonas oryzae]